MATQATIQTHIDKGLGIAAMHLGAPFALYRPLSTNPVLANINLLAVINLAFNVDARFSHKAAGGYGHPVYFGLIDLTGVMIGDYLTDEESNVFYIANIEPLRPALMVQCNRTITVYRPTGGPPGGEYYGGNVTGTGTVELTDWPASILHGPKGEKNDSTLPADPRSPWFQILLPEFPGVMIATGDLIIDDNELRYTASACELTELGWRITAAYSGT